MMAVTLEAIRDCFEGVIPAVLGTADAKGTPNVSYLSQVQYQDEQHVALTYQFFNKTRVNLMENPHARLLVTHPRTGAQYALQLEYLRTETSGALFETMKAKLAGLASHTGMSGVFRLLGSDVFRVHAIDCVDGDQVPAPALPLNRLAALRHCVERLMACRDLGRLFEETVSCIHDKLDISHSMLLMHDIASDVLYTVASHGYAASGVGSEIAVGDGVIGVAARERVPIRIGHMTSEYSYGRMIREETENSGLGVSFDTEIPFPGLTASRSQLAIPVHGCDSLLGVLYVESPQDLRFSYDDEDTLVTLCAQLAMSIHILLQAAPQEPTPVVEDLAAPQGETLQVRYYATNHTVFIGDDYLIKGVAGAILWSLLQDHAADGRTCFSNRELRADPRINLPGGSDNLEARLVLLARRLDERCDAVAIERTGRGHFRLIVRRPLQLIGVANT